MYVIHQYLLNNYFKNNNFILLVTEQTIKYCFDKCLNI